MCEPTWRLGGDAGIASCPFSRSLSTVCERMLAVAPMTRIFMLAILALVEGIGGRRPKSVGALLSRRGFLDDRSDFVRVGHHQGVRRTVDDDGLRGMGAVSHEAHHRRRNVAIL